MKYQDKIGGSMKTCYIFGACEGMPEKFQPNSNDLIIAADGGMNILNKLKVSPCILLGDFDSLNEKICFDGEIVRYPVKKDDTDTMLAIKTGLERGYKNFVLYGCTGGRLDHTIANIQALNYIAENNALGYLCGDDFTVTVIKEGKIEFDPKAKGNVSVFSLSNTSEVTIEGLLYNIKDTKISNSDPLGVSNEFIGQKSQITVNSGTVIIYWSNGL